MLQPLMQPKKAYGFDDSLEKSSARLLTQSLSTQTANLPLCLQKMVAIMHAPNILTYDTISFVLLLKTILFASFIVPLTI